LVLSRLSLFIDYEESTILWKILDSNASEVEHAPSTVLHILAPESFLKIWPRESGADNGARERCLKYGSSSDINSGLLRMLQNKKLGASFNGRCEFTDAVRKNPTA
jgi:hypothetical protein